MNDDRKSVRWARGFFRLWIVVSLCWVAFTGWLAYADYPADTSYYASITHGSDRFTVQQVESMRQRAISANDTEAVNEFTRALDNKAEEMRMRRSQHIEQYLLLIAMPPVFLLICGVLVSWIIRGFRRA